MRTEFPQWVKNRVAERSGFRCSFPQCDTTTIGPADAAGNSMSTGVACHIFSAAPTGPRGQGGLTSDELAGINNAIWLCANHARVIDANQGTDYSPECLWKFKTDHESLIASEHRGVALGFQIQSVTIEQSPVFTKDATIHLARTTVVSGGNGSGKTALCEWLAGSGDIRLLKRWSPLTRPIRDTRVRFDAVMPRPMNWIVRVFGASDIKFEMNGQAVPRLNLAFEFVYASACPRWMPDETTSSYLARWLHTDPAHINNVVQSLALRGGFHVHNPRFVTQENHEALLLDIDGTISGLNFRALSSGEKIQVAIEFAVEFARLAAEQKPTVLLIDCMQGLDQANFQDYLEFLANPREQFQTIITALPGKTDRLDTDIDGLRIATLRGTVRDVEIR